jgi:hypothetical protein
MSEIILNEDFLLRRVPSVDPRYIKEDNSISSFAFSKKKDEDGLSVNLERLTTYDASILDRNRFRLYRLKAEFVRSLEGLEIEHDPQPDNESHSLITGNITKSKASAMSKEARLVSQE